MSSEAAVCPECDGTPADAAATPGPRAAGVEGTTTSGVPARLTSVPDRLTIAFLDGYGPIPASAARALAAGSTWSRLVLDPIDRTVLEVSSPAYRPPESMARLVRSAQPYCAGPTCNVSADSCDLNHRIPYPVGATSVWNLDPGCRRDHLLITHGGWHYRQDPEPGGPRTWTTATGHVYEQQIDGDVRMVARRPLAQVHGDDTPPPF
ncbi:HNH endonuclease signature motif containing protein [Pseudactinotalea sp.]|uniref:HNH endonuclease signature motif containing protein n=1 Tax=Pseudactinotalea sp. TaxID=1926260 RepID=UPI003B39FDF6